MAGARRKRVRYVSIRGIESGDFSIHPLDDLSDFFIHTFKRPSLVSGFFGGRSVHQIEHRHAGIPDENQSVREWHTTERPKRGKKKKNMRDMGGLRFRP